MGEGNGDVGLSAYGILLKTNRNEFSKKIVIELFWTAYECVYHCNLKETDFYFSQFFTYVTNVLHHRLVEQ